MASSGLGIANSRPASAVLSPERVLLTTTISNPTQTSPNKKLSLDLHKTDLEERTLNAISSAATSLPKATIKASGAADTLGRGIKATVNLDNNLDRTLANLDKMSSMAVELNSNATSMKGSFASSVGETLDLLK
ncbi:hypothetical protein SmJEL517_g04750 [Synchytrium microbalum]|uniref:BLOC-1-related complex subunit 7 n=1 Tax=Synchytrium microbalum TaxID=1806994 RepID=A0A507BSQ2_9FUNG|nr:uncharacterized protein SmJEL517_g04750 [Synchytrium microbalum]TPX32087.1 hypothetical protein SmJEL517_g04750 [Synchytrium microbalum]